jgi:hypothetical protein
MAPDTPSFWYKMYSPVQWYPFPSLDPIPNLITPSLPPISLLMPESYENVLPCVKTSSAAGHGQQIPSSPDCTPASFSGELVCNIVFHSLIILDWSSIQTTHFQSGPHTWAVAQTRTRRWHRYRRRSVMWCACLLCLQLLWLTYWLKAISTSPSCSGPRISAPTWQHLRECPLYSLHRKYSDVLLTFSIP